MKLKYRYPLLHEFSKEVEAELLRNVFCLKLLLLVEREH